MKVLRTVLQLLAPVWAILFFWWSAWSINLANTSPHEPNAATGQVWKIEQRGPLESYVTQQDYIVYNSAWLFALSVALVTVVIIPLAIGLFKPKLWRELTDRSGTEA